MKNPGLIIFADTMTQERPPTHPIWGDVNDDVDPDRRLGDDEEGSDFVRTVGFGRWRNPGQSLRVPTHVGPPFAPEDTPENIVHGEVISPAEEDGANRILQGEHESSRPSDNPVVEHARRELSTPESAMAVDALSGLLSGRHATISQESMDAAHEYLSRHFTGVRVNPHHGTLEAVSPAGSQVAKRRENLPAVPDAPLEKPDYSLTNKHGTFESHDARRLMRTMVAFQILHNEMARKKKEDRDQDQDNSLTSTSGIRHRIERAMDSIHRALTPLVDPELNAPEHTVFEPGHGTDRNHHGVRGGYVALDSDAPSEWRRDASGIAYSPGHIMNEMLDPVKAVKPRPDPYFPGHTFTYSRAVGTGHTIERFGGGMKYFVTKLHPAARGVGFDLPPQVKEKPAKRAPRHRAPVSEGNQLPPATSAVKVNDLCPVCVSGYLEPYDSDTHECLNCGSLVKHVGFERQASKKPPRGGLGRGLKQIMEYEGDPLNLAAGGSEDPDDALEQATLEEFAHPLADEELDPEYIGYEAPKRILDKRANEEESEYTKEDHDRFHVHSRPDCWMCHEEEEDNEPEESDELVTRDNLAGSVDYVAPKRDLFERLNSVKQAGEAGADPLDEQLGKFGYFPIHRKDADTRIYLAPLPGTPGGYARLTEGLNNSGWVLTADQDLHKEPWTQGGKPYRQKSIPVDRATKDQQQIKQFRQPLTDLGERTMAEKSILATGHHPIDDDALNRAARDLATNGRNSHTFQRTLDTAYEPPAIPRTTDTEGTQRQKRMLSSVNPGLNRFVS